MSVAEEVTELPYGWAADVQQRFALAQGLIAAEIVVEHTAQGLVAGAEEETEAVLGPPLATRYPAAASVYDMLARSAADATYVPASDRETFIGGRSATIDSATMQVIEEIAAPTSGTQTEITTTQATDESGGMMGRVARGMRAKMVQATEAQRDRELREQRQRDQTEFETLRRIHGDPEKALSIFLRGRYPNEDVALRTAEILAAFQGDPGWDITSLLARAELSDAQARLLSQQDRRGDLSRLREDMAEKRNDGTVFLASEADRYTHLAQQHADRELDTSGAVAARDWYAQRDAARAEAAERNRPDGKAFIVTDENVGSAGLIGPLLARLGIAEIHTAGMPYHELTKSFLERVTGSTFFKQPDYNDVNQQYALIVLQGQHPPIKPTEFMAQVGRRAGDMGVIPGSVNQPFVDELLTRLHDPRSTFHDQFTIEKRPSSLVGVRLGPDGAPMIEVQRQYERETYVLVRRVQAVA